MSPNPSPKTQQAKDGLLAAVLEAVRDAVVSVDDNRRIVLFNGGAERIFGYSAVEIIGSSVDVLIPSGLIESHRDRVTGRRRDGTEFPAEASISEVKLDGKPYLTAILRDVGHEKQTREELHRSEERYRGIFDYSNDAIFIVDPAENQIVDANPRACGMLDYSHEELLAMPVSAVHPEEMPKLRAFARDVFEAGHGWTNELSCITRHRTVIPAEISASTIQVDDRKLMVAMVRDIRERKRVEEADRELAVLEERNRLARDLHDSVTQSLYSMTLFAESGRRLAASYDGQVAGYLQRLGETSLQALKEMRLLVYELRSPALEADGLVGALQNRLDAVEGRAGIATKLLTEGWVDLPAKVEMDAFHVAQEALNNSLKHSGAESVRVAITAEPDSVELTVQDDGCGFEVETAFAGAGVGLTGMRERVEMLGGTLDIESNLNQGTKLVARLPIGTAQR